MTNTEREEFLEIFQTVEALCMRLNQISNLKKTSRIRREDWFLLNMIKRISLEVLPNLPEPTKKDMKKAIALQDKTRKELAGGPDGTEIIREMRDET